MEVWRYFKNTGDRVSTAEGLAIDDTLPLSLAAHGSPPILHLYTFRPSAIVGKYQDIEAALQLDRCRDRGIEFNRRSTGGGTVIMGPKVVALGLGIDIDQPGLGGGIKRIFETLSRVLMRALEECGVTAAFVPKNDLVVEGKKVAGLSAALEAEKAILFHASLLVDFDIDLMLDIMNQPPLKMSDKGYNCFSQRMTTITEQVGHDVHMENVFEAIAAAFSDRFGISLETDAPDAWENQRIKEFTQNRYTNPEWIFSRKHPRSHMGTGMLKTPGGLLEIYLSLAGNTIEHIIITGDFFSTTRDINLLETSLKWTSSNKQKIEEHLSEVWKDDMIYGLDVPTLTEAILIAKEDALNPAQEAM
ncbi:MAG: lipoate--protein ligase [Thermodesulfobacteriota bacterium]